MANAKHPADYFSSYISDLAWFLWLANQTAKVSVSTTLCTVNIYLAAPMGKLNRTRLTST